MWHLMYICAHCNCPAEIPLPDAEFDDDWWEPSPSQDAEKRIPREGFIVLGREAGRI